MYNKKVGPTIEPSEALVSIGHFYKDPPPPSPHPELSKAVYWSEMKK